MTSRRFDVIERWPRPNGYRQVMAIPVYVAIEVFRAGIYAAWTLATIYACALELAFVLRYHQGKCKEMRVIESSPPLAEGRCQGLAAAKEVSTTD